MKKKSDLIVIDGAKNTPQEIIEKACSVIHLEKCVIEGKIYDPILDCGCLFVTDENLHDLIKDALEDIGEGEKVRIIIEIQNPPTEE